MSLGCDLPLGLCRIVYYYIWHYCFIIYQQIISMLQVVNLSDWTHVPHRDATFTLLALTIISKLI